MSAPRLRAFAPKGGKLVEIWLSREEAHVLANAPRAPGLVVVGTMNGHSELIFEGVDRITKVRVMTTQARRLAEAAIWVGAVHAMAAMAELGAAALELTTEAGAA